MRYILGPRGSGKTTELIRLSAEHGYYIVCANRYVVRHIRNLALDMGLNIPTPITYDTLMNSDFGRGRRVPGILIDDLGVFLMSLLPHAPVIAGSDTPDGLKILDIPIMENLLDNLTDDYSNELDDV